MSDAWGKVSTLASGDHARGCQGRSYTCECGHDDAIQGALSFAKVEITRLQAELAEARDKALDEAAGEAIRQKWSDTIVAACDRDGDEGPRWFNDACDEAAQAIRALKSPKPQED